TLCADAWLSVLDSYQREALIDLHLTRCQLEYVPMIVIDEETGEKKVLKDEFGRIQYSDVIKTDEDGNPKWFVAPLDILVFQENVKRFGCWLADLQELKTVIE